MNTQTTSGHDRTQALLKCSSRTSGMSTTSSGFTTWDRHLRYAVMAAYGGSTSAFCGEVALAIRTPSMGPRLHRAQLARGVLEAGRHQRGWKG